MYLAVDVLLGGDGGIIQGVAGGRGDVLGKAMLSCVAEVPSISRLRASTNVVGLVLSHFPHFLLREGFANHVRVERSTIHNVLLGVVIGCTAEPSSIRSFDHNISCQIIDSLLITLGDHMHGRYISRVIVILLLFLLHVNYV